jgi:hypothetical protein
MPSNLHMPRYFSYFFLRKKVSKSSCNGFELDCVKFPRKSKSIPKNAKLTSFKQLHFLNGITLLFLGSADVATEGSNLVVFLCDYLFPHAKQYLFFR